MLGDINMIFAARTPQLATVCLLLGTGMSLSACGGAAEAAGNAGAPLMSAESSTGSAAAAPSEPAVGG